LEKKRNKYTKQQN